LILGCPAISIPISLSNNGMPLALQLLAPNFGENVMLNVANQIERMVDFPKLVIEDGL
jgi:Asp-tRNA(Asn)/Glu-tRNA(Gln) amidotransferase A subunit family amidase